MFNGWQPAFDPVLYNARKLDVKFRDFDVSCNRLRRIDRAYAAHYFARDDGGLPPADESTRRSV